MGSLSKRLQLDNFVHGMFIQVLCYGIYIDLLYGMFSRIDIYMYYLLQLLEYISTQNVIGCQTRPIS